MRRFAVGEKVYAYEFGNPQGGFYAQFATVDAEHVGRLPKRLDLRAAGAAAATGLTRSAESRSSAATRHTF